MPESSNSVILFLDVNMPTMTGWEFLDNFILIPEEVKTLFHIYILSSAIEDFEGRAYKVPICKGFSK